MASTLNAAIGAAIAVLFWTGLGLALTRRLVPELALPMAPVVGWAVHGAIALPVFFVLPFSAAHVVIVAGLSGVAAIAASRAAVPVRPIAGTTASAAPIWAYALAALLAAAPAAAILPKFAGDAVNLAAPIFDHAKVALISDMMKSGLPPGNPFFSDPYPRLTYYYLWHFSAAELGLATGISDWEADVAMTWFASFAALAVMMGLAARLGGRAAAVLVIIISMTASARIALDWIFESDNVDAVIERAGGFGGWLFQSAWVPQHVLSAACVVAAVTLMTELAQRRSLLLVTALALVVAASFESSTWIGGIAFAAAAPAAAAVMMGRIGWRQRWRFAASLVVAAVLAAGFAIPLLRDQLAVTAGKASPIALHFYPVLGPDFSASLHAAFDPPAFWLVLLPIELSAVYVIGVMALALPFSPHKFQDDGSSEVRALMVRALAALAFASLAVCWLLVSTLAENDDLGWRAILPAAMALTVLAAAGLWRWMATRARIAVTAAGVAIAAGVPGGIDLISSYVIGWTSPAASQFAAAPELWAAVRRHAGPGERVGNNPLLLAEMTPWPVNISWALLADRRSCYGGRELALVYTTLGPQRVDEINAQFINVFAGTGSTADVRELATTYDCRVVVVTATDGAWASDPFAASPYYRLAEERAEQWRIYRTTGVE
jgi:hypothetical protein